MSSFSPCTYLYTQTLLSAAALQCGEEAARALEGLARVSVYTVKSINNVYVRKSAHVCASATVTQSVYTWQWSGVEAFVVKHSQVTCCIIITEYRYSNMHRHNKTGTSVRRYWQYARSETAQRCRRTYTVRTVRKTNNARFETSTVAPATAYAHG